ncbi:DMT family transporter [Stella sp.]|uniref:DMT family transporter n=1 Tax=Stella sp. TaxID=2912054 RepID=UPI0035B204A2
MPPTPSGRFRVIALTALAILAFAGNSLLTRPALAGGEIGPALFMGLRLASGAVMLALLCLRRPAAILPRRADLPGVAALFAYAAAFTFAYLELGAATGALILFALVQLGLAGLASAAGRPPGRRETAGLLVAFAGLVWLLAPGATQPPLLPALLMAAAGIAWAVYTLVGRGAADPLGRTARNFVGAALLGLLVVFAVPEPAPTVTGVALALASGMVTSALGYAVWYAVLPRLSVATAGAAQLLVPVVAAAGAALWLGEVLSPRLVAAAMVVLGGIWITIAPRRPPA